MASDRDIASNNVLLEMMRNVMHKVDTLSDTVSDLRYRMSALEKSMEDLKGQHSAPVASASPSSNTEDLLKLATMVCFNNPYNILFLGIPKSPGLSVDENFRRFMIETLEMDKVFVHNMSMCVVQLANMSAQDQTPPVCVSFLTPDSKYLAEAFKRNHEVVKKLGITAKFSRQQGQLIVKL